MTDRISVQQRTPLLIAHRGGVIGPATPQCSILAIKRAAHHGYDMVELDVQESRDGEPIVFHDEDLLTACAIDKNVYDLTVTQVTQIPYRASDQYIATLDSALVLCKSLDLGVMLDIGTFDHAPGSDPDFNRIADLVEKHGLSHATMPITLDPQVRKWLGRSVMLVVSREDSAKISNGKPVDLTGQFWFGAARKLSLESVALFQQSGAFVIPAINTFLYPSHADRELAMEDIKRFTEVGVDGFQLDSIYEDLIPID